MKLRTVLGKHGQTQDLRTGDVRVEGFELDLVDVKRMPDAYRDMARTQPYDICEMAPTTYLVAREAGAPITALALPMTRRFRHQGIVRTRGSSIRGPKDLEGREVGVRAYAVTAAVWTRGILAEDYGLDLSKITWLTEEDENVTSVPLPSNVRRADETLASLVHHGKLEAGFAGIAGLGPEVTDVVDIVEDAPARERAWFERTGIYPIHGVIVVKDDVLAAHPKLPLALFDAFSAAKASYLTRIGDSGDPEDKRYRALRELVGDPLPYGFAENAPSLEALARYAYGQGLLARTPDLRAAFLDPRSHS